MRLIDLSITLAACSMALLVSGCVTLYKPNAVQAPLLRDRGDGSVSASIGIAGTGLANVQTSYAFSDRVGIMANGMYHYRMSDYSSHDESGTEKTHIYSAEGAIGFLERFGTSKNNVIHVFAGVGYGTADATIFRADEPDPDVSADFITAFIQPGIYFPMEHIQMGADVRMKYARLYHINAFLYDEFEWWNTNYQFTADSTIEFVLFEPNFTLTAGSKHLKGILQAGFTIPVVNAEGYFATNSNLFYMGSIVKFSMGVTYSFGRSEKKAKPVQP